MANKAYLTKHTMAQLNGIFNKYNDNSVFT